VLKKGENAAQKCVRPDGRISVRNNPAVTKVRQEGRRGDAPGWEEGEELEMKE